MNGASESEAPSGAGVSEPMARLQAAVALGFTVSEAVQKLLGRTLTSWAEANGHRQNEVTMCLLKYHQRIYPEIRDGLARDIGVTRAEFDSFIDGQGTTEPAPVERVV